MTHPTSLLSFTISILQPHTHTCVWPEPTFSSFLRPFAGHRLPFGRYPPPLCPWFDRSAASLTRAINPPLLLAVAAAVVVKNEVSRLVLEDRGCVSFAWGFYGTVHDQNWLLYDKVTVLESEKRAWENSPEAQAMREALNPWRHIDAEGTKKS